MIRPMWTTRSSAASLIGSDAVKWHETKTIWISDYLHDGAAIVHATPTFSLTQ